MRLKLEGCSHARAVSYATTTNGTVTELHATCTGCYQRLVFTEVDQRVTVRPDIPAVLCHHPHKKPISEEITRKLPYQDALCVTCGRVLRHPDGPGRWEEVRFYGYLIPEETLA